ncbi:hypothetical protein HYS95_02030 [Candidatus Daviesbacteria bacterium]|nr:hypothetical protein [Candidatus Daviesbacteria bacterium]
MGARCELCIETEIDPNVVCKRPDTPLVQGRKEYRKGSDKWVLKEKMEWCPIYMLFKGAREIIETDEVIRLKPRVPIIFDEPLKVRTVGVELVGIR